MMEKDSLKYIVLSSALLGVLALNTTKINAEETTGSVETDQPAVNTESPSPEETQEPTVSPTPEQTATPSETPAATPSAQNENANELEKAPVSNGDTGEGVPVKTGEQRENGHWIYIDEKTGQKVTSSFKHIDALNKTAYYDENGYMLFSFQTIDGKKYYFDPANGALQYGEHKIDGKWYYFDPATGAMATGFTNIGYKTVYYNDEGQMLFGFQTIGGKKYYLDPRVGTLQLGEKKIDGYWYYFDPATGAMATGFTNIGYKTVYYNDQGQMLFGFQTIDGKKYYLDPRVGTQQLGEKKIDGYWYYFDQKNNGAAAVGLTDLGYKTVYYDSDGRMLFGVQHLRINEDAKEQAYYFDSNNGTFGKSGWIKGSVNGKQYYAGENGALLNGRQTIDGKTYYFDPDTYELKLGWVPEENAFYAKDGTVYKDVSGEKKIDGHWYYFDETTHQPITGFFKNIKLNKTVYYDTNGEMQFGEKKINGHWYYFRPGDGTMATGITNIGYKTVYYNEKGEMEFGEKKLGGYWYYFRPGDGAMATGITNLGYKTVYYDGNGRMVFHNFQLNGIYYEVNPADGSVRVASYRHGGVPYFSQVDPRWSSRRYGGMTMGATGCGVTTIAMNLTAWLGYTVLPPTVADYLYSVGQYNGRIAGTTGYSRIAAGNYWGVKVDKITSLQQLRNALNQGKTISEMTGAGYFANTNHGVVAFGNGSTVTVYDPYNSRNNGTYSVDYLWNARTFDPSQYDCGAVIFAYYR